MADIQIITDVPLFTNEQNQNDKKLIVLSPSSLPFDDNPIKNSHNLVDSNTIYNLKQNIINTALPIGTIIAFAGTKSNTPSEYLICNGAEISRQAYKELYNIIGTIYGSGDGKTTFNIPDLSNKFIMGSQNDQHVGAVKEAGLPNISGLYNPRQLNKMGALTPQGIASGAFVRGPQMTSNNHIGSVSGNKSYNLIFDASKSNAIYGNSNTVQPPAIVMYFCIKYKNKEI